MSDRFILLTQNACPQCERLKMMLAKPLRGEFDDRIEIVHLSEHEERFRELVSEYGVRSTPALLDPTRAIKCTDPGNLHAVKTFLNRQ